MTEKERRWLTIAMSLIQQYGVLVADELITRSASEADVSFATVKQYLRKHSAPFMEFEMKRENIPHDTVMPNGSTMTYEAYGMGVRLRSNPHAKARSSAFTPISF